MPLPSIAYVVNNSSFFVSHRLPVAMSAKSSGHDIQVFSPDDDKPSITALGNLGLTWNRAHYSRKRMLPLQAFRLFLQGWSEASKNSNTIYHLITLAPILCWGIPLRIFNRPTILAFTGLGTLFSPKAPLALRFIRPMINIIMEWLGRGPRVRMIFQNQDDFAFAKKFFRISPEKMILIRGSGVDSDVFPFLETYDPPKTPKFLLPARLIREKGIEDLCQASAILSDWGFAHSMLIAGESDPGNPLSFSSDAIDRLKAQYPHVQFLGKRNDIPQLLKEVTAVAFPSTYGEGVPKALIEAAARGIPMIAYNVPGCREIVRSGHTGILVAPGDVQALADALQSLAENKDGAEKLRQGAYRLFKESFQSHTVAKATLTVYQSLADKDLATTKDKGNTAQRELST